MHSQHNVQDAPAILVVEAMRQSCSDTFTTNKLPRWAGVVIVCQALALVVLVAAGSQHIGSLRASRSDAQLDGSRQFVKQMVDPLVDVGRKGGQGTLRPRPSVLPDACRAYLEEPWDHTFSVILTADPGDFSGQSEAHHILANLQHTKMKPRSQTVCGNHYQGYLMGSPVLVITTGIGPTAAALCTSELLSACGAAVNEIIYFGTSGWSPQVGGILDPDDCSAAKSNGRTTRLGDVCVSPFSVNWVCKKTTWDAQAEGFPNQCWRPEEVAGPNATLLYGECQFYGRKGAQRDADLRLSDELTTAGRSAIKGSRMLVRSKAVVEFEEDYWQRMSEGTKLTYPVPGYEAPRLWDHTLCMETDTQLFYTGIPWEVKARDYVAETLNAAMQWRDEDLVDRDDVVAVLAMEGVGVAEALGKYRSLASSQGHVIAYTNVRAASNWVHQPITQVSPGSWEVYRELAEDYVNGYGYAIATGSTVILQLFQSRCVAAGEGASFCTYHLE